MSIVFFGVGFILFSIYLILLIWNIIYNGNKQQEENYPTLQDNVIDNQDRFPGKIVKHKKVKSK